MTITVAGNGESCIQAVRTLPQNSSHNELNQIDTTINIGSHDDSPPIRIIANPYSQLALPGAGIDQRLVDGECLNLFKLIYEVPLIKLLFFLCSF